MPSGLQAYYVQVAQYLEKSFAAACLSPPSVTHLQQTLSLSSQVQRQILRIHSYMSHVKYA